DSPRAAGARGGRVGGGGSSAAPRAPRVLPPRYARAGAAAPRTPPSRPGAGSPAAAGGPGGSMRVGKGPSIAREGKINGARGARAAFYQHVLRDGLRRIETRAWATRATALDVADTEVLFAVTAAGWRAAVLQMGACLLSLSLGDGLVTARIAHRDE